PSYCLQFPAIRYSCLSVDFIFSFFFFFVDFLLLVSFCRLPSSSLPRYNRPPFGCFPPFLRYFSPSHRQNAFSTAICLTLATITCQVSALPSPRNVKTIKPEPPKVMAGMLWTPGSPGSKYVDDALNKIIGKRRVAKEAPIVSSI
ncbi:hypothetical protein GGTG_09954, partial [Gaeumannomyces tritici R3-111a-1]